MCVPIPINQPTLILNQPPKSLLNCDRNELGWVRVLTKVKQCPWFQIIHSSSMKMVSTYYSFVFSYHLVHEEREGASTYITLHIMIIPLPFSCENSFIWSIYIFLAKPPIVMFCWGFSSAPISNFVTVKALYSTGKSLIQKKLYSRRSTWQNHVVICNFAFGLRAILIQRA